MKSFCEIVNQNSVYLHEWKEKIDLISDFEEIYMSGEEYRFEESPYPNIDAFNNKKRKMTDAIDKYKNINILFATYGEDNYSGDAWVLFEESGRLYEVNGSHCSCYGLEGQWEPEETTLESIEYRVLNGTFGEDDYSGNEFKSELKEFLGIK